MMMDIANFSIRNSFDESLERCTFLLKMFLKNCARLKHSADINDKDIIPHIYIYLCIMFQ